MRILNEGYDSNSRADQCFDKYIVIDNRKVLDASMGCGTSLFGHGFIPSRIQSDFVGALFTYPNRITDECGELLHQCTGFEYFAFCNSGSEAVMRAIRIARHITARDKVAVFKGCWHGTHDWNLFLYSCGIPKSVADLMMVLDFDDESLEKIEKERPALVLVEPIQGALPINRIEFLKKLRSVTEDNDILLCFDEVISGFRTSVGGASELYGVRPDLVCYGKSVSGGFPVGIVGGSDVIEDVVKSVRLGGTFSGNPLTALSVRESLKNILKYRPHEHIREITNGLGFRSEKIQVIGTGNIFRIVFSGGEIKSIDDRDKSELPVKIKKMFLDRLLDNGVYVGGNNLILLSSVHTNDDVNIIKKCLKECEANI